ncbi:uncharacterized protein LOC133196819 [Saccostrea echinata]|uniref:uncharacterized protein LOC133196819 n=1 Tax=Saccostrea echinata TaxID=191078 RepID=UPI002A7F30E6|nr:uncharacterized protein LOC133196819 [Saccostrea echinata]
MSKGAFIQIYEIQSIRATYASKISSKSKRLYVAAIGFGTTYTGLAYSSKAAWKNVVVRNWNGGKFVSNKTPTALLLNPDKSFNSFGYEAEEKYAQLAEMEFDDEEEDISKKDCKIEQKRYNQRRDREDTRSDDSVYIVYQKAYDGTLKEILPATAVPLGGTTVDKEFSTLIEGTAGKGIFKELKKENMEDFIDIFRQFETKKRNEATSKVRVSIPLSLDRLVKKKMKGGISKLLESMSLKTDISYESSSKKLVLSSDFFYWSVQENNRWYHAAY